MNAEPLAAPDPSLPILGKAEVQVPKSRKPYTIKKQRESWTDEEHMRFLEALKKYDRDWKRIEAYVGTKNAAQIHSHAQKYFLKVQKNNTGDHVPPPGGGGSRYPPRVQGGQSQEEKNRKRREKKQREREAKAAESGCGLVSSHS